jgi:hypothetical protein
MHRPWWYFPFNEKTTEVRERSIAVVLLYLCHCLVALAGRNIWRIRSLCFSFVFCRVFTHIFLVFRRLLRDMHVHCFRAPPPRGIERFYAYSCVFILHFVIYCQ